MQLNQSKALVFRSHTPLFCYSTIGSDFKSLIYVRMREEKEEHEKRPLTDIFTADQRMTRSGGQGTSGVLRYSLFLSHRQFLTLFLSPFNTHSRA